MFREICETYFMFIPFTSQVVRCFKRSPVAEAMIRFLFTSRYNHKWTERKFVDSVRLCCVCKEGPIVIWRLSNIQLIPNLFGFQWTPLRLVTSPPHPNKNSPLKVEINLSYFYKGQNVGSENKNKKWTRKIKMTSVVEYYKMET